MGTTLLGGAGDMRGPLSAAHDGVDVAGAAEGASCTDDAGATAGASSDGGV